MSEARATLDDYELLARLGRGRNGEVFLALRRGAGREKIVAVKRLRADGKGLAGSLLTEAELVARIEHPQVVEVYEYGEAGGDCYIAMEYLPGRPLGSLIKRHGPLPPACVAQIGADIAEGLHAVHRLRGDDDAPLGLVHLDVSPSNIQILYEGRAMLLDFGLARAAADATARGKIGYLAPEQVRRERADARTDVFALGIVLWEAMTGRRLFRRGGRKETFAAITGEPAPPPSARGVPGDLDEVLARALAVDREDRFATAADLAVVLREHIPEGADPRGELRALMREHFEAERSAAEAVIEEALGAGDDEPEGDPEDDHWDAAAHLESIRPRWGRRAIIALALVSVFALIAGIVLGLRS